MAGPHATENFKKAQRCEAAEQRVQDLLKKAYRVYVAVIRLSEGLPPGDDDPATHTDAIALLERLSQTHRLVPRSLTNNDTELVLRRLADAAAPYTREEMAEVFRSTLARSKDSEAPR